MLADEFPEMDFRAPQARGGSAVHLHVYVEDVDGVFKQALGAGAREVRPVQDQFYGDRLGTVADPFGHVWHVVDPQGRPLDGGAEAARRRGGGAAQDVAEGRRGAVNLPAHGEAAAPPPPRRAEDPGGIGAATPRRPRAAPSGSR